MEINWNILNKINIMLAVTLPLLTLVFYGLLNYWKQYKKIKELKKTISCLENKEILSKGNLLFDAVISNAEEVKSKLLHIIKNNNTSRTLKIDNFGLDLETVITLFNYTLNSKLMKRDVEYRGLIISPDSEDIKKICNGDSNLCQNTAKKSIEYLRKIKLKSNTNISIELYSYDKPPIIHGFLIDDEYLIIGFTHFESGGLVGGATPYLYIERDKNSQFKEDLFTTYKTWFHFWLVNGTKEISDTHDNKAI